MFSNAKNNNTQSIELNGVTDFVYANDHQESVDAGLPNNTTNVIIDPLLPEVDAQQFLEAERVAQDALDQVENLENELAAEEWFAGLAAKVKPSDENKKKELEEYLQEEPASENFNKLKKLEQEAAERVKQARQRRQQLLLKQLQQRQDQIDLRKKLLIELKEKLQQQQQQQDNDVGTPPSKRKFLIQDEEERTVDSEKQKVQLGSFKNKYPNLYNFLKISLIVSGIVLLAAGISAALVFSGGLAAIGGVPLIAIFGATLVGELAVTAILTAGLTLVASFFTSIAVGIKSLVTYKRDNALENNGESFSSTHSRFLEKKLLSTSQENVMQSEAPTKTSKVVVKSEPISKKTVVNLCDIEVDYQPQSPSV